MEIGLLVRIEAKPEFADQVEKALRGARDLAQDERETVAWFAFRQSSTVFGVFDTFNDEHGRTQHLQGQIAAALGQIAQTMLASPPVISEIDLLGVKVPSCTPTPAAAETAHHPDENDRGTRHMDHKERNHPVMEPLYTAVASANGRDGRATSADGQLDLKLAFPPALGGDGNGTNPEQLFAAGYAACFASTLGVIGRETKVDTRDVSVTAEVSIGKDTDGGFGISVALLVRIPEEQDSDTVRALVEQAHTACPYSKATHGNIPVELRVQ